MTGQTGPRTGQDGGAQPQEVSFALDITADAVVLRARWRDGWEERARAPISEDGEITGIAKLRQAAGARLTDPAPRVRVLMPPEQVLTRTERLEGDALQRRARAFEIMAEATGQAPADLAVAVGPAGDMSECLVIAAYAQSVREAIAYAQGWGFEPVQVTTAVDGADRLAGGLTLAPLGAERAVQSAVPAAAAAPPPAADATRAPRRRRTGLGWVVAVAALAGAAAGAWFAPPDWRDRLTRSATDAVAALERLAPSEADPQTSPEPAPPGATVQAARPTHAQARDGAAAVGTPDLGPVPAHETEPRAILPAHPPRRGAVPADIPPPPLKRGPQLRPVLAAGVGPPVSPSHPTSATGLMVPPDLATGPEGPGASTTELATARQQPPDRILEDPVAPPGAPSTPRAIVAADRDRVFEPLSLRSPLRPAAFTRHGRVKVRPKARIALRDVWRWRPDAGLAARPELHAGMRFPATLPVERASTAALTAALREGDVTPPPPRPLTAAEEAAALALAGGDAGGGDTGNSDSEASDNGASDNEDGPAGELAPVAMAAPRAARRETADSTDALAPAPQARSGSTVAALADGSIRLVPPLPDDGEILEAPAEGSAPATLDLPLDDEDMTPTVLAVQGAPAPRSRPEGLGAPIRPSSTSERASLTSLPVLGRRVPARVQTAARESTISLSKTSLIGVLNLDTGRQALLRLADGKYQRIGVGDSVGGWRVDSIGTNRIRLSQGGREQTLVLATR